MIDINVKDFKNPLNNHIEALTIVSWEDNDTLKYIGTFDGNETIIKLNEDGKWLDVTNEESNQLTTALGDVITHHIA